MAKEVTGPGRRGEQIESLRAADSDRQLIADQLKGALDEGRLSLHEYDDRVAAAYAAQTYAELLVLVRDLPQPGTSAAEVRARQAAESRRESRRLPVALIVLWTVWAALAAVNLVVYALVRTTVDHEIYPWPVWMLVPGAALAAVTAGVQVLRHQQRRP
ncbi:hypothetical protein ACWT_0632 [Actinoplanes sp. SE50]|uniref:DUF1707 SHOCT-like domain-containing protein n=1 Tax=unclassified Actinoplanes TaxID=2626549 RepID=UPI00023ED18A|nr:MULTISPECIES: DUF1707 domain-containing protein [unclassified Actinoplanes]AEV81646.1 uncharacterized protein ACPL_749 [Actinoplanes sp. SE50/110]ATO80047.1 hypothetical protein ACWT_0632 [Actinoplanes sp. SE50]SLL97451.1 uncharacterized protein ACSP50_0654 [Actinoplanes sp. SE50/110]